MPAGKDTEMGDIDWHEDSCRLSAGLMAISNADKDAPASVLRLIAYDIALNCMDAETAAYQIRRRTDLQR